MPRPVVPILATAFCRLFAGPVELAVERQDQRRVLGDHQLLGGDLDALRADRLDLAHQVPRVEHHAVADHR